LLLLVGVGCATSYYADYDFLKKADGVIVGKPIKNTEGEWFLPLDFETRVMHSAQYIDGVKVDIRNNNILLKALVVHVKRGREPSMFKGINLGKLSNGVYNIKYLNNDGSFVPVCQIEIKEENKAEEK